MAYKTVLTILRNDALIAMQIASAAEIARRFDDRLLVAGQREATRLHSAHRAHSITGSTKWSAFSLKPDCQRCVIVLVLV